MSAGIPAVSLKPFASNASRRGTTSVTVRCGSISTQDIAIATIAEPTSTSPTTPKNVRKQSARRLVSVVRQPSSRNIFSVLCSTPRKPPFPTPRNVGWSKRAVSRNPSSPNYASRNRRNLCRSSARRSVVSASTILKAGNW